MGEVMGYGVNLCSIKAVPLKQVVFGNYLLSQEVVRGILKGHSWLCDYTPKNSSGYVKKTAREEAAKWIVGRPRDGDARKVRRFLTSIAKRFTQSALRERIIMLYPTQPFLGESEFNPSVANPDHTAIVKSATPSRDAQSIDCGQITHAQRDINESSEVCSPYRVYGRRRWQIRSYETLGDISSGRGRVRRKTNSLQPVGTFAGSARQS